MKASTKTIVIDATRHEYDTNIGIEETIRARAYKLYEQRGRADGHDMEDWLQAEAEIANTKQETASA